MESQEAAIIFIAGITLGGIATYLILNKYFPPTQTQTYKPAAVNKETWEWTDWKGRKRTITVHREVKTLG